MTQPRSNSRRFVNAAWSLLTFQLIASAGAVAVTGYAAFHVRNLVSGAQQGPVEAAIAAPEISTAPADAAPAPADAAPAPADATPGPAASAPAEGAAPPPAAPVNDGRGTLRLTLDGRGRIEASLADPDGVSERRRFTWFRDGVAISGAAGPTYALQAADSGRVITARASYVDGDGFEERAESAPLQLDTFIQ